VGDALGMPTQLLSRADIAARFGLPVPGFEAGPADHPIAAGRPPASVTDDTEQAVLVGRLLVAGGGHVAPAELAAALGAWEKDMERRGSLDLLGPSTRRAIAAVAAGTPPEEAGRQGDTNGAAMRIAPVGILVDGADETALVDRVVEVSRVTHHTGVALAGAAAVAAALSAGIAGLPAATGVARAVAAAHVAARRGWWVAGADVAERIVWAVGLVTGRDEADAMAVIASLVGTGLATQESVPAAFAVLAAVPDDPWRACRQAASLGGDTDTIAAMVGAVAGARAGVDTFPAPAVEAIAAQGFRLDELAAELLALR
jgi:ADP-ribosylglycohydrolase